MIDPEHSSLETIRIQKTMNRRFDVISCGGHELSRDLGLFTKKCLQHIYYVIKNGVISDEFRKDLAQIKAIQDRGQSHNFSLWIVVE